VVVEVVGAGQLLEQGAAFVEGDFDLTAVADAGPGLGLLGVQLDGGRSAGCGGAARFGGGQDAAVVAAGEREPGAHLLRPGHDLGAAGFLAQAPGRLPGRFGGVAVD
jgi:hypothetical protein